MEPVLHGPGLHSLQALVPSLLRREVEMALEKLGLIWDRTYAWDMFLDMMVRRFSIKSLRKTNKLLKIVMHFISYRQVKPCILFQMLTYLHILLMPLGPFW